MTNVNIAVSEVIESKTQRQVYLDRVDVLEKVKKLAMNKYLEFMTTIETANYFEVENTVIEKLVCRNLEELKDSGYKVESLARVREILNGQVVHLEKNTKETRGVPKGQVVSLVKDTPKEMRENLNLHKAGLENIKENRLVGKVVFTTPEGTEIIVPNRGLRAYNRRSILNIAMLLRDSPVAKEIRKYLLDTEELVQDKVSDGIINENELTKNIDTEIESLQMKMGQAFFSGSPMEIVKAAGEIIQLKNHQIESQSLVISTQQKENEILTGNKLKWKIKASINKLARLVASKSSGSNYGYKLGVAWREAYSDLNYKMGINVNNRAGKGLDRLSSDEQKQLLFILFDTLVEMGEDKEKVVLLLDKHCSLG